MTSSQAIDRRGKLLWIGSILLILANAALLQRRYSWGICDELVGLCTSLQWIGESPSGDFVLAVFPTYYISAASWMWVTDSHSLIIPRILTLVYALSALRVWYLCLKISGKNPNEIIRLALFRPLIVYSGLYYTEWPALFWAGATYLCHLEGKSRQASLCFFIAVAFRQTNIVWAIPILAECLPESINWRRLWTGWKSPGTAVGVLANLGIFAAYFTWQGGPSFTPNPNHVLNLNTTGLFFYLAILAIVELPFLLRRIWRNLRTKANGLFWVGILALGGMGMISFQLASYYNTTLPWYFLHNQVLLWAQNDLWARAILMGLGSMGLVLILLSLKDKLWPNLALLGMCAFLLLHTMIEHRYILSFYTYWLWWRAGQEEPTTHFDYAWSAAMSLAAVGWVQSGRFL